MMKTDLRNRIDTLSTEGKKLFLLKLEQSLRSEAAQNLDSGHKRLVAYVKGTESFDQAELKSYLRENLPDFMIPSSFLTVDEFPTLPNGKVDRRELSRLKSKTADISSQEVGVLSDTEAKLKSIWEEILNFSPIDIHDNFFEIGGDSILSIQIIAKSRKAGINIAPNQLFEHQTISELALFISTEHTEVTASEIVVGEMPLTPIQHWYFETHKNAPSYWNQGVRISGNLFDDREKVEGSISRLVEIHEALRLAFRLEGPKWKAEALAPENSSPFEYYDFSTFSIDDISKRQAEALIDIQNSFQLHQGNLFKCLYFDFGPTQENQCILVANHLVIDAVSWGILLEDLHESLKSSENAFENKIMSSRTSLKDWANYLYGMVESKSNDTEHEYWKMQTTGLKSLPKDMDESLPILEKDVERIDFKLDANETARLLLANEKYKTKTEELLLIALQGSLQQWTGTKEVVIGLERHGRESKDTTKNPSETIGWLTSYFPIKLKGVEDQDISAQVKSTKEKLRTVPDGGLGFGILKYLKGALQEEPMPQVVFNFLGTQNTSASKRAFKVESINTGLRHELSERYYLLEINSFLKDGELFFSWAYGRKIHLASTIENRIDDFKSVIKELVDFNVDEGSNYSPSDFPEADLNQDDLDNLLNSLG